MSTPTTKVPDVTYSWTEPAKPTEVGQRVRTHSWGGNVRQWMANANLTGTVVRFTPSGNAVVRLDGKPEGDSRGWQFKLLEVEAEVDVWNPTDYDITIAYVHAQRILVTGKPGQLLRLVGTFYEPIYAAARLAIEEYLRDRGEIW